MRGIAQTALHGAKRQTRRQLDRVAHERDRVRRRLQHRVHLRDVTAPPEVARLRQHGIAVLPDVFDPEALTALRRDFERHLDTGEGIERAPDDALRTAGERGNADRRLTEADLMRGQQYFRHRTNRATLASPMVAMPSLLPIALDRRLFEVAAAYLRSVPAVGSVTLRKSFVNDLPEFDTQLFHVDPNAFRFVKFFVYLDDVDAGCGPFRYVRSSHRRRIPGWWRHQRWTDEEVLAHFGQDAVVDATASAGSVVVADTTGFHRGTRPRTGDRWMITISYVVAPEYGGKYPRNQVRREDLDRLEGWQRAAASFLEPVD